MFGKGIKLPFKLAGIPVYLDVSFLIVFPLLVWITASNLSALVHNPQFGVDLDPTPFTPLVSLLLGLVTVIGLFSSVVLHELGHSLTARRYGVGARRITLWFLGGVAEFEQMPRQRGAEAVVAIAGPIVSFILAALFFGLLAIVPQSVPTLWVVLWFLAAMNLMLAVFNLIPAMPMDGGRILRSLLALRVPYVRATSIAANVARVIAVLLGAWGLINGSVWTIFLAVFIFTAARRESLATTFTDLLKGLSVGDLMSRDIRPVPASMTLGELSYTIFSTHYTGFPVVDGSGGLIGTVGIEQLRNFPPQTPVWQVMSTDIIGVPYTSPAELAMERMAATGAHRLIVLDETGRMCGLITRDDMERALQIRMSGFQVTPAAQSPYTGHRPLYASVAHSGYTR